MLDQVERVLAPTDPGELEPEQPPVTQQGAAPRLPGELGEHERVVQVEPEREPDLVGPERRRVEAVERLHHVGLEAAPLAGVGEQLGGELVGLAQRPEDPKPPSPRAVALSSAASTGTASAIATTTS